MREGWQVILQYNPAWHTMDMWLLKENRDGSEIVVQPLNLTMTTTLTPGLELPPPTLRFAQRGEAENFLNELAKALVKAGFRPDELKAKDNELEATKNHLEDMRSLVFNALLPPEIPPPRLQR